jgi:hypothetical protein
VGQQVGSNPDRLAAVRRGGVPIVTASKLARHLSPTLTARGWMSVNSARRSISSAAAIRSGARETPKPQPPRPDKIRITGDVEQKLVRLVCSDPPEGRCHGTL